MKEWVFLASTVNIDISPKPPCQKNPFTVIKNWKNVNRKFFLIHCKLFCMRLLRLAPGPHTAQRMKNSLLSSWMDSGHHLHICMKGPKVNSVTSWPGHLDGLTGTRRTLTWLRNLPLIWEIPYSLLPQCLPLNSPKEPDAEHRGVGCRTRGRMHG